VQLPACDMLFVVWLCFFFLFSCLIMVSQGHVIIFSSSISIETHTSGVVH
jgi:hypothetical protein